MSTIEFRPRNMATDLTAKRDFSRNVCRHEAVVDERHRTFECGSCGVTLDPIQWLAEWARRRDRVLDREERAQDKLAKLHDLSPQMERLEVECSRFARYSVRVTLRDNTGVATGASARGGLDLVDSIIAAGERARKKLK